MNRRWKVTFALAAVGIGGFLIWAFLVASKPVLTLRFTGYETNTYKASGIGSPPPERMVFAVFVMSNGSPRSILCLSNYGSATWGNLESKSSSPWTRGPGGGLIALSAPVPRPVGHTLDPTRTGKIFVSVRDFHEPVHVWVAYQKVPDASPFWSRVPPRLRWPEWVRSVETTIQEP